MTKMMAKVIQLPANPPAKLGFKKARTKRGCEADKRGQLNLFSSGDPQIISLPSRFTTFEEALWLDEKGDAGAQEAYLKAILENDCVADAYCNLGILESQSGNKVRAFDCFTKCLKLEPRHLEAHYNLANLYFEECDYKLARLHYEISAEIEPEFPNIYFNLGLVYALNDEYKDAINSLFKYKSLVSSTEGKKVDNLLKSLRRSLYGK
jgi:tetratricopeptide (TPR) repeat protein